MLFGLAPPASAAWSPGDLTLIELKMTGSESAVIENTSANPIDLQNYLVEYFNKAVPPSLATPTSVQQLPAITLQPSQSILLNSDSSSTCGAAAVANLGFSLSDTSGQLVVMRIDTQTDGSLIYRAQDHVSWTSSSSGADLLKVPSNSNDPQAAWYRSLAIGSWQQAELSGCTVLLSIVDPSTDPTFVQWASGQEPAATFALAGSSPSAIPEGDLGLASPMITELLPNPAAPQSDSEDEFIELYNPNDSAFDLSGFKLEIGNSVKHFYLIDAGAVLGAKSFMAFFSVDTGLSLSNSSGQAWLLDPLGTAISQTGAYGAAKDGQAWALANGYWHWTASPTPGGPNIITEPLTTSSLSLSGAASKSYKSKSVKTKAAKTTAKTVKAPNNSQPVTATSAAAAAPIHPAVLAGIGAAALLYALYEYRNDLANHIYKLRRDRAARPAIRKKP